MGSKNFRYCDHTVDRLADRWSQQYCHYHFISYSAPTLSEHELSVIQSYTNLVIHVSEQSVPKRHVWSALKNLSIPWLMVAASYEQHTEAIKYENVRKYHLRILRDPDSYMNKEQESALYLMTTINAHCFLISGWHAIRLSFRNAKIYSIFILNH